MAFWRAANRPLVTGQTTDRTTAGRTSKDDGGERSGAARAFEKLTAGQYSGTTDITVNAKTDTHSNNVTVDKRTGLMWTTTVSASVGPTNNGLLLWDGTAGADEDVFEYCDKANIASLAGYSDWRVPNIMELFGVFTFEAPSATPDPTYFNWTDNTLYSSTTVTNSTTNALVVSCVAGTAFNGAKTSSTRRLVLVRG